MYESHPVLQVYSTFVCISLSYKCVHEMHSSCEIQGTFSFHDKLWLFSKYLSSWSGITCFSFNKIWYYKQYHTIVLTIFFYFQKSCWAPIEMPRKNAICCLISTNFQQSVSLTNIILTDSSQLVMSWQLSQIMSILITLGQK